MTTLFNDPSEFADDQLAGFADLYSDRLVAVPGGVVAHRGEQPLVAVVVGGGSGHYPAFAGLVGPGFASGAVVGNIFTSPSAAQVYSVAKAADQGRGVVLTFGNYAGDVMNFGIAAERLRREGIDTRVVLVTDDVASSPSEEQRRGIAGDFTVFKAMGAAAAAGHDLDDVERVGRAANAATRSFGVAFSGCTMPGAAAPLFTVPAGNMGVGLGIHGEPGIHDAPLGTARELAKLLVDGVLAARPSTRLQTAGEHGAPARAAVVVNGLGTTKYEELFLLWGSIAPLLREAAIEPVDVEVGELVTSLDMGGTSLTLMWLDDELESLWSAPAYTPAYRKDGGVIAGLRPADVAGLDAAADDAPSPSAAGAALAPLVMAGLRTISEVIAANEIELGRIDAVAGDGDHGRGMRRGAEAALAAATAAGSLCGPAWLLTRAGRAWAAQAGGTSGVLWGAGLEAAGASLTDEREQYTAADAVAAVDAFASALLDLGRAEIGDKTIVDALVPFAEALARGVDRGEPLHDAWRTAAFAATKAAEATAVLSPKRGRARPLAEKSIGTPDAGATSFGLIVDALAGLAAPQTT
ncbi:dihydroxyacetone kinase family protein [Sinomonas sp. ASV322]|uniref:dihydroxyacetone kinase family protein n=1 Tax=Sinomonas sp. ASV322 TaxID=3041920 RepID=UPI0027DE685A|nr:dihydroxyacetone kinase family protein [Sinomonas sp. ASV322]MDQ4504024.1 dihydroxyacetone kinase family protein [Sinomonas sp. ASV322]